MNCRPNWVLWLARSSRLMASRRLAVLTLRRRGRFSVWSTKWRTDPRKAVGGAQVVEVSCRVVAEFSRWSAEVQHCAPRCYTLYMPTTRLRHSITETPDIEQAVDEAQLIWPEASRPEVMRHLIVRGARATRLDLEQRRAAVQKWSGFLPGVYPSDAAASLKEEWPV